MLLVTARMRTLPLAVIFESLCGSTGKYDTVREALKDLDASYDGILSREEIKQYLKDNYILKYTDFYTGQVRGKIDEATVDTIMDAVDKNNDGKIHYDEFSSEVMAGANTYFRMDLPQHGVAIG